MSTLQIDCLAHSKDVVIHCDWSEKLLDYITLICVLTLLWMVVIWTGFKGGSIAFEPGTNILHSIHGTFVWSILQKHSNWDVRRAFKTFFPAPYQKNKKTFFVSVGEKNGSVFQRWETLFICLGTNCFKSKGEKGEEGRVPKCLSTHHSSGSQLLLQLTKVPPSFYQVPYKKSDSCNR